MYFSYIPYICSFLISKLHGWAPKLSYWFYNIGFFFNLFEKQMHPNRNLPRTSTQFYRLVPRETALLPFFLTFLPWRLTSINPVPVTTWPNQLHPYLLLPIETIGTTTTRWFWQLPQKIKLLMFHPISQRVILPCPIKMTLTSCPVFPTPLITTLTRWHKT